MSQQNPEAINSAGKRLNDIITEGRKQAGISPNCNPKNPPSWYDSVAFEHAQRLHRSYGVIIALTHFYGLLLGLCQPDGLLPLLTTGQSKSISCLFSRYFSTGLHVTNWFTNDPFDPRSKAYKSLKIVRGLHRQVFCKLNKVASIQSQDGVDHQKLWMSQYSMCGAQFSFFGLMALFPRELGYHNFTRKDLHSIFHFWRVIGYCMGIDDQFNLCSGSDEEVIELCRIIYNGNFILNMQEKKETYGTEVSKGICLAFSNINPTLSYNVLMHYFAPCLKINPNNYPLENVNEKFHYQILKFLLTSVSKCEFACWVLTCMNSFMVQIMMWFMSLYETFLQHKYGDIQFKADSRCPFQVKINYKPLFG